MIGFRILLSWVYINTGRSLFAVILLHAVYNVSVSVIPGFERPLGPGLAGVLVIIIVPIVTRVWEWRTLSQLKGETQSA
ncbi:MAG: hypothetical protein GTO12_01580 [Proteobacteria bacterium]|nr:hypothetical protein [Pseudomonadota bacterium]